MEQQIIQPVSNINNNIQHTQNNIDNKCIKAQQTNNTQHKRQLKPPRTHRKLKYKELLTQKTIRNLIGYFNHHKQFSMSIIARKLGLSIKKINQARNQYFQTKNIRPTNDIPQDPQVEKQPSSKVSRKFQSASRIMAQLIENNPTISAAAIRQQLIKKQLLILPKSINYILHQQGYIYTRLDYTTFSKNTPESIQDRFDYTQELKNYNLDQLIYVAQSTFNATNTACHGWVKQKKHQQFKLPQNPNNISVLAVANIEHIVGYYMKRGPLEAGEVFNLIFQNVLPIYKPGDAVIIGPLKVGSAGQIKEYFRDNQLVVKDLPQYSPQLNPLQSLFSVVKASFRKIRDEKRIKDPHKIERLVKELMEEHRTSDLASNFKKMREHFRLAQRKQQFQHAV